MDLHVHESPRLLLRNLASTTQTSPLLSWPPSDRMKKNILPIRMQRQMRYVDVIRLLFFDQTPLFGWCVVRYNLIIYTIETHV